CCAHQKKEPHHDGSHISLLIVGALGPASTRFAALGEGNLIIHAMLAHSQGLYAAERRVADGVPTPLYFMLFGGIACRTNSRPGGARCVPRSCAGRSSWDEVITT